MKKNKKITSLVLFALMLMFAVVTVSSAFAEESIPSGQNFQRNRSISAPPAQYYYAPPMASRPEVSAKQFKALEKKVNALYTKNKNAIADLNSKFDDVASEVEDSKNAIAAVKTDVTNLRSEYDVTVAAVSKTAKKVTTLEGDLKELTEKVWFRTTIGSILGILMLPLFALIVFWIVRSFGGGERKEKREKREKREPPCHKMEGDP